MLRSFPPIASSVPYSQAPLVDASPCGTVRLGTLVAHPVGKVESYHAFAEWLSFGNLGHILDNDPVEMEKQIKFNHLVANCLMLQNVLDMSQAIRDLIEEGYPVTRQTVQGLSAYLHGHIRRYGDYELEVEDVPPPISEEALTTVFERIMQGVAASEGADDTGASPALEAH